MLQNNKKLVKVLKNQKTYQKLNLLQTIDLKTFVNEKIAPGSSGYFYIYLISNSDLSYEIEIISKTEKPKNFEFQIEENKGNLEKNKMKKIRIDWKWLYKSLSNGTYRIVKYALEDSSLEKKYFSVEFEITE